MKNSPIYKYRLLKPVFLLWVIISCLGWSKLAYASGNYKIAVLPYKNLTSSPELNWLGEGVAQYLAHKFDRYTSITTIERSKLQYLRYTQQVSDLAAADSQEVQAIGRATNARLIIYGDYTLENKLIVNTYLMEVSSGEVRESFNNYGVLEEILDWQNQIMLNLLEKLNFEFTPQAKQAISTRETTSFAAYKNYTEAYLLFTDGETDKVIPLCRKAIELDPKYTEAVGLLIKVYESKNQWDKIPDLYQKYESLLYENRNWRKLNEVYDKIITIYSNSAEFSLALRYCGKKLGLVKKMGNTAEMSLIYAKVATLYQGKNELDKAISYFQKVLKLQERLGGQNVIGNTYTSIGDVYFAKESHVKALKNYNKSVGIWRLLNDKNALAASLNKIGKVLLQQQKYDEALNHFEQALSIQQMLNEQIKMAEVYSNTGNLYLKQLSYDKAMNYYNKAMHIYEKEGNSAGLIISIYNKVGNIHLRRNHLNHALLVYQKIQDIQENTDDPKLPYTYDKLGSIYLAKKNYELALKFFEKSLETQIITGHKELLGQTHHNLATLYEKRENYQKALKYYLKNLLLYRRDNNKIGQAKTYYHIGSIYDKMNQYNTAINYMERTVQIDKELNAPNLNKHLNHLNQLKQKLSRDQAEAVVDIE